MLMCTRSWSVSRSRCGRCDKHSQSGTLLDAPWTAPAPQAPACLQAFQLLSNSLDAEARAWQDLRWFQEVPRFFFL